MTTTTTTRERAAALVLAQIPDLAYEPHAGAARGIVTELLAAEVADRTTRTLVLLAAHCLGLGTVAMADLERLGHTQRQAIGGLVWALAIGSEAELTRWVEGATGGPDDDTRRALRRARYHAQAAVQECHDAIDRIDGAAVDQRYRTRSLTDGIAP